MFNSVITSCMYVSVISTNFMILPHLLSFSGIADRLSNDAIVQLLISSEVDFIHIKSAIPRLRHRCLTFKDGHIPNSCPC
eukprot:g3469.t1